MHRTLRLLEIYDLRLSIDDLILGVLCGLCGQKSLRPSAFIGGFYVLPAGFFGKWGE